MKQGLNGINVLGIIALGIIVLGSTLPVFAAEKTKPVRMGCGLMTFDTVPGWGLRPDGNSALGPTHGAVVVDSAGNIFTSAQKGVVVFSPDGKVIHSYLGKDYSNIGSSGILVADFGVCRPVPDLCSGSTKGPVTISLKRSGSKASSAARTAPTGTRTAICMSKIGTSPDAS